MIAQAQASKNEEAFGVWEDNAETFMMFLRLRTQWNTVPGGVLGLKYESIDFLFRVYKVENQREMLDELQDMERAALDVLNAKKD